MAKRFLHQSHKAFPVCFKRSFLLLEVMIALTIVALAVLPLIYPHFHVYKQQKQFTDKIAVDLAVGNIYTSILQKLHQNEFLFTDIEQSRKFPIDASFLGELGYKSSFPYKGHFHFTIPKQKKNEQYGLYLVNLILEMNPVQKSEKALLYKYEIFLSRLFTTGSAANAPAESSTTNAPTTL